MSAESNFEAHLFSQWKASVRREAALEAQLEAAGQDPAEAPLWRRIAEQRKAIKSLLVQVRIWQEQARIASESLAPGGQVVQSGDITTMPANITGADLIRTRRAARLTQTQLAERIGVSLRTIGNWELGKTRIHPKHYQSLTAALGSMWLAQIAASSGEHSSLIRGNTWGGNYYLEADVREAQERAWDEAVEAFIGNLPVGGPVVVIPENPYKAVAA